ncbi:HAAS signaling domain-containing protein [Saccharothrix sp. Mg75]|uniref:HAAS signaling domain-containing protein n=1 Tax=Saccharothrix sp. Mg75 TaxID=3445357 RepID=UPI003EE9341E
MEHPLVAAYLTALREEAAVLPEARRAELDEAVRSHIEATLPEDASDDDVDAVLDELGAPGEVVATAVEEVPENARRAEADDAREPLRVLDVLGLALLLVGAVLVPFGHLAGAVLVGVSRRWSIPVRVLLVGVPAVLHVLLALVADDWYSGLLVLPFTATQVAALIATWYFFSRAERG